jgi:hypothetical protein
MARFKVTPKDVFGKPLKVGEKIMYLTGSHGWTVLNWGEIKDITWKDTVANQYLAYIPFVIKVEKYAEGATGWRSSDLPKIVHLTNPHAFKVGGTIPEKPK